VRKESATSGPENFLWNCTVCYYAGILTRVFVRIKSKSNAQFNMKLLGN